MTVNGSVFNPVLSRRYEVAVQYMLTGVLGFLSFNVRVRDSISEPMFFNGEEVTEHLSPFDKWEGAPANALYWQTKPATLVSDAISEFGGARGVVQGFPHSFFSLQTFVG
jgi:hypothetical protein